MQTEENKRKSNSLTQEPKKHGGGYGQKNIYQHDRIVLKERLPLKMPLCLSIEPTNICNFHCAMCFHGNNEHDEQAKPLKNMDQEVFRKSISDLKNWTDTTGEKVKLIKLYSLGEPLIHPGLLDMVKELKASGVAEQLEITTNGSLLTKEISNQLISYGLDIIRFSIYGIGAKEHRRITGSDVSVDEIFENIRYLYEERNRKRSAKPMIFAKMFDAGKHKNDRFLKHYEAVVDMAGIDEIFSVDVGNGKNVFEHYYSVRDADGFRPAAGMGTEGKKRPCRYPFTHMTIRSDGTVVSCCSDWRKELRIGNVIQHSLQELWESRTLYQVRKQMIETKGQCFHACRSCGIPYRDLPQDSMDGIGIERFGYQNNF